MNFLKKKKQQKQAPEARIFKFIIYKKIVKSFFVVQNFNIALNKVDPFGATSPPRRPHQRQPRQNGTNQRKSRHLQSQQSQISQLRPQTPRPSPARPTPTRLPPTRAPRKAHGSEKIDLV